MRMTDIILKKREGEVLSKEEIQYFIQNYTNGTIPDYQASALLMAICFQGMNKLEIKELTDAMLHSGETIDLSSIPGVKCDKHSTGGVGDKTSLVVGPLVASCGVKIAKMSGRGLGHTGGTLDKLESIPGFCISLSEEDFMKQVRETGIAIVGQTKELVPADKKLYALRDVTATVESIPLISSSIMSKKLASGSDAILLDVKCGAGAFMKDLKQAQELARTMVEIGKDMGRDTRAEITDMDQPLGYAVGNSLEVIEAVHTLLGNGPEDFKELCLESSATMLEQAHVVKTHAEGRRLVEEKILDGSAFAKLKEMVEAQGGDSSYLDDVSKFPTTKYQVDIISSCDGYVERIDALKIGETAMHLGAGRATKESSIDLAAGLLLHKKIGDFVKKGEALLTLYTNLEDFEGAQKLAKEAFSFSEKPIAKRKIILQVIE